MLAGEGQSLRCWAGPWRGRCWPPSSPPQSAAGSDRSTAPVTYTHTHTGLVTHNYTGIRTCTSPCYGLYLYAEINVHNGSIVNTYNIHITKGMRMVHFLPRNTRILKYTACKGFYPERAVSSACCPAPPSQSGGGTFMALSLVKALTS